LLLESKNMKNFLLLLFIIGVIFLAGCAGQTQTPSESTKGTTALITKSPSELLPTRNDLSTEWILGDIKDLTINFIGFESGSQQEVRLGTLPPRNVITISIYEFSSVTTSNDYYTNKTSDDYYLQKGGYKKVDMKINAKCEAYKVDRMVAETGQAYCVSSNIFFELKVVSESFQAEKYLKDIGKIISQKIS